jgi:hypothetical protein
MAFAFSAAPDPKKGCFWQAGNSVSLETRNLLGCHARIAVSDLIQLFNEAASDDPFDGCEG